jgi:hypothetical protein
MDMGAYVVVVNADQVVVTGRKPQQKTYFRHVNGRPGSWKVETFEQLQQVRKGSAAGRQAPATVNLLEWVRGTLLCMMICSVAYHSMGLCSLSAEVPRGSHPLLYPFMHT